MMAAEQKERQRAVYAPLVMFHFSNAHARDARHVSGRSDHLKIGGNRFNSDAMDERELSLSLSQIPPLKYDEYGFLITADDLDGIESRCHVYR